VDPWESRGTRVTNREYPSGCCTLSYIPNLVDYGRRRGGSITQSSRDQVEGGDDIVQGWRRRFGDGPWERA
jgi:hypothetical protein